MAAADKALQITAAGAYQRVPTANFVEVGTGIRSSSGDLTLTPASGSVVIAGNLTVQGTQTYVDSTTVLIRDRHLYLNTDYTTVAGQSGGLVINFLPTATATTVSGAGYTAGVVSGAQPTVITTGSATFTAGNIIQISGSGTNDGLYEVNTHVGTTLTLKGVGTVSAVEDFTQNQLTTGASDSATITKVNVAVIRASTAGVFETAAGSTSPLTFSNVGNSTGSGVANQVVTWSGTSTQIGSNNLRFDGSTLTVTGAISQGSGTINFNSNGAVQILSTTTSLYDAGSSLSLGTSSATSVGIGRTTTQTTVNGALVQNPGVASAFTLLGTANSSVSTGNTLTVQGSSGLSLVGGGGGNGVTLDGSTAILIGGANANAITLGHGTILTTVIGGLSVSGAAITLASTGASTHTSTTTLTIQGNTGLTLTGGGASTWSTNAGALTISGASTASLTAAGGALTLNGTSGIVLQGSGVTVITIDSAGSTATVANTKTLTIGTGASLSLDGNLNGSDVDATKVTGTNLNTLTNGSDATGLHTHTSGASTVVDASFLAGESILAGEAVMIKNSGSNTPRIFRADATTNATFIGFASVAQGSVDGAITVRVSGETITLVDLRWSDTLPAVTNVGQRVFLSATTGKVTLTAPDTSGQTKLKVGILTAGGTGACKVLLQTGDSVLV